MTIAQTGERTPQKPLRLWPGVVAAVLLVLLRCVVGPFAMCTRLRPMQA